MNSYLLVYDSAQAASDALPYICPQCHRGRSFIRHYTSPTNASIQTFHYMCVSCKRPATGKIQHPGQNPQSSVKKSCFSKPY